MKTVLTIIKKELKRFFGDKRFVLTAILLPGILIYAMYSLVGSLTESMTKEASDYRPSAIVVHMPSDVPFAGNVSLEAALAAAFDLRSYESEESAKQAVADGNVDVFVVFPEDFASLTTSSEVKGNVQIYYNSAMEHSSLGYTMFAALLDVYESSMANVFDVNSPLAGVEYDLASEDSLSRQILSMVVPMVLLMLLFSSCMPVASESIAGEKERGTMATLLVTPAKRSHIAAGKIIALSCVALLGGLCSTLGLILSLPKLVGGAVNMSFGMYSVGDYFSILGVVLSTVLILITLISIVSAFAKSIKEANGLVVPIMIVVMLCGVFSMFVGTVTGIGLYFIPVFNSALVISSVLSGAINVAGVAVTVCMNVAFAVLLGFVLTLMFKSERIMFNK